MGTMQISLVMFIFWLSVAVCAGFLLQCLLDAAARSARRGNEVIKSKQSREWMREIGKAQDERIPADDNGPEKSKKPAYSCRKNMPVSYVSPAVCRRRVEALKHKDKPENKAMALEWSFCAGCVGARPQK